MKLHILCSEQGIKKRGGCEWQVSVLETVKVWTFITKDLENQNGWIVLFACLFHDIQSDMQNKIELFVVFFKEEQSVFK